MKKFSKQETRGKSLGCVWRVWVWQRGRGGQRSAGEGEIEEVAREGRGGGRERQERAGDGRGEIDRDEEVARVAREARMGRGGQGRER